VDAGYVWVSVDATPWVV